MILFSVNGVTISQGLYPLGEGYRWTYASSYDSTHIEAVDYPYLINHNGFEYYTVNNFRYDDRTVGLRNDGMKVHILTGLNTTPVDCVLYDFEAEEGEYWMVYDADEEINYQMVMESKNDTVVWGDSISPITSQCFLFNAVGPTDWGYMEWVSYYYEQNGAMSGWAGIVKRIQITIGGGSEWICTDFYSPLSIDENPLPQNFKLLQPYPNPFNPTTTIRFNISVESLRATSLRIYDITGRLVETLANGELQSGEHEIMWYANGLPSGVYFVRLQSGESSQTQKIILMK